MASRLRAWLRWEDVVLSLVAAIGLPVALHILGGPVAGDDGSSAAGEPSVLTGLFGLLAIVGVIACLCTRSPDEPPPLADSQLTLQGWARFPLAAGVGIVAVETLPGIGLDDGPVAAITFLVVFATALAHGLLPVVPVAARRAMVTPMVLLSAGAFDRIIGGGIGDTLGSVVTGQAPREVTDFLPLIVAAVATVYVMLVVAPRAIADPGASGTAWVARFGLLLVSLTVGSLVAAAIG